MNIINSDDPRYVQDDSGQWWFTPVGSKSYRRTRCRMAVCEGCHGDFITRIANQRFCSFPCKVDSQRSPILERVCASCGQMFTTKNQRQRNCSHACYMRAYQAAKPVTTLGVGAIKNSDNPHYSCDEKGQWWYTPGRPAERKYSRTRAIIETCRECGERFLGNIYHHGRPLVYCSRSCALWQGGRSIDKNGYVRVREKNGPKKGRLEHRIVMEQMLGRPLKKGEEVHHKNGLRDDNRAENLELWAHHQPPGQRAHEQKHCPTCTCNT